MLTLSGPKSEKSLNNWGHTLGDSQLRPKEEGTTSSRPNMKHVSGHTLYANAKQDMETLEKFIEELTPAQRNDYSFQEIMLPASPQVIKSPEPETSAFENQNV